MFKVCMDWFKTHANKHLSASRALLFNLSKGKDAETLLKIIVQFHKEIPFDQIVFTTNDTGLENGSDDLANFMVEKNALKEQEAYQKLFKELSADETPTKLTATLTEAVDHLKTVDHVLITGSLHLVGASLSVFESI
jgi:folylpolyglutamate synthase/dihydropteroate synthase